MSNSEIIKMLHADRANARSMSKSTEACHDDFVRPRVTLSIAGIKSIAYVARPQSAHTMTAVSMSGLPSAFNTGDGTSHFLLKNGGGPRHGS